MWTNKKERQKLQCQNAVGAIFTILDTILVTTKYPRKQQM